MREHSIAEWARVNRGGHSVCSMDSLEAAPVLYA